MSTFSSLSNKAIERQLFIKRMNVAFFLVTILFSVLVGRLFYLQIFDHAKYESLSENNRLEVLPIAPIRGLIYDRNGVILAD